MKKEVISLLHRLLNTDEKKEAKKISKELFILFAEEFNLNTDQRENIKTLYSEALNTYDSGYCIAYPVRTKKSLLSVINRLTGAEKTVLYIGTGPFAPYFVFPLLLGVSAKFTLIDINGQSLKILKKVIDKFELQSNVLEVVKCDATEWKTDRIYDTVLCETSDVGLRREDTLPIYKNLMPQMPKAVFIPKDITILAGSGKTNQSIPYDSLLQAVERGYLNTELPIPATEQPFVQNRIILDDEQILEPYESVVTMPLFI